MEIRERIDEMKLELYELINVYELVDERVVKKSQELDILLNKARH